MNNFVSPTALLASPQIMSEKEKQKRIHTWLGEQTSDYLKQLSLDRDIVSPEQYHCQSHKEISKQINSNCEASKNVLLKSKSDFISGEDLQKHGDKNGFDRVKEKSISRTYQTNLFPFVNRVHNVAATKIQALWRGYYARLKNPRVVGARHEIRARRAEQYITTLCNELSVLKQKMKADKKLRDLQTEAIRFMWSQIQQIQSNYDSKISDLELKLAEFKSTDETVSQSSLLKDNLNAEEKNDKEQLRNMVEKLQSQVIQLQDALLSFSDRLVSENEEVSAHSIHGDNEEKKDCSVSICADEEIRSDNLPTSINLSQIEDDEMLSARNDVPKMTVLSVLEAIDSCLTEKELWSICEQALLCLKALKTIKLNYISPTTMYIQKDGLVSFINKNLPLDTTYCAPELFNEGQNPSVKTLIFSLAVTIWSAADFKMTEEQAPCLSPDFESLLIKMSHDELAQRATIDEALKICSEHHSTTHSNSLEICASLYAETCDLKKGKKRQIKSVNLAELFAKEIEKTRSDFQSSVVPQITTVSFKLKPASERQLRPKPKQEESLYESFLKEVQKGSPLKKQAEPILYTVQDLFKDNPELIQKLNVLPGQRRKNMMAVKSAIKKLSATDGRPMFPSPPQGLKAEIKSHSSDYCLSTSSSRSLILRWHPSYIYDKEGNKMKSEGIIGYRIYVNRQPKGMVNGIKCRALLDGLKRSGEYRVHLCAVSALGESDPSNTVVANLETQFVSSFPASPKTKSSNRFTSVKQDLPKSPTPYQPELANRNQSADVVERVLERYGIKKLAFGEPSHPINSSKRENTEFLPSISNVNCPKPISTSLIGKRPSGIISDCFSSDYAASSSSGDDHITPRTKALLDQLKDELLG